MGVRLKLNLALLGMALVGFGLFAMVEWSYLTAQAKDEVLVRARIVMESAAGIRKYTLDEIAPLLNTRLDNTFHVQAVSAYAATKNLSALHAHFPDYSYREAALNPTNLRDRATESEVDIINDFRATPSLTEMISERQTHNGMVLFMARPLVAKSGCLVCHDTPARAPAAMVAEYGSQNGFGWKQDEIIGAQIVSVPAHVVEDSAMETLKLSLILRAATFAFFMIVVNLLIEFLIIRPVVRMSRVAADVSMGKLDAEEYVKSGTDQLSQLAVSFNRMKRSLVEALKLIETPTR
jgi:HAMP domain-containing protein